MSYVGYALSLFFDGKLQKSMIAFQSAFDASTEVKKTKNEVMLYLSQVLFALGSPKHLELAKQQLLERYIG